VVGAIGAAGLLTALVPGSMLLMSLSTILAKNVYAKMVPTASERTVARVAKSLVPVIALVAVYFTFRGGTTLVVLLLMGYNFVTQLFPALVFSLGRAPFATRAGAFAGIIAGEITVAYLTITESTMATLVPTWPEVIRDLNVGIVAMVVNVVVLAAVSMVTRRSAVGRRAEPAELVH
jgi:SSS family solute:Na+ symporter